jgi:hypothetical protein
MLTSLQDVTVTTESDYLTQREAFEALFDLPSHQNPQPTIERESPQASTPLARQIKKETEETMGIYGSCLEDDFIRAQSPCPETSGGRLGIESPRYITASSTATSRPSSPRLPSDNSSLPTFASLSYPHSPPAKRTPPQMQTPPLSRASSGSSPASPISDLITATDYYSRMPSESINVESRTWREYSEDYLLVNRLQLDAGDDSPVDLSTVVVPEAPVVPDLLKMSRLSRKRGRSVDELLEGPVKRR